MKLIFENWRKYITEQESSVRSQYEEAYPARPDSNKIKNNILRTAKAVQSEIIKSFKKNGRKRLQYEKSFPEVANKEVFSSIVKAVKRIKFKILLGWTPEIDDSMHKAFLEDPVKYARTAGWDTGSWTIFIGADNLIKNNLLEDILSNTIRHEILGHVVAETFENKTGVRPSQKQWRPDSWDRDELGKGISRILKRECIKRAVGGAIGTVDAETKEAAAIKDLYAQLVPLGAKGFTKEDYNAICRDQKQINFKDTESFKKYGGIAQCIICKYEDGVPVDKRGVVDVLDQLAAADIKDVDSQLA
jgi:hypothetical protein